MTGRRALDLNFELVMPDCLRLVLSARDGPIIDVVEVSPRSEAAYGPFLAVLDLVAGEKDLRVMTNFPYEAGRATAPKTICKRVVQAALEAGNERQSAQKV